LQKKQRHPRLSREIHANDSEAYFTGKIRLDLLN